MRVVFVEFIFSLVYHSASKSIGSTDLKNMKRRMQLISSEAKTELKQNVYRNHTKFIETAKEVSSLESEVYQLHSLLADQKQLLNTVKELLSVDTKVILSFDRSNNLIELQFSDRFCSNVGRRFLGNVNSSLPKFRFSSDEQRSTARS